MIDYAELVHALDAWRARQGLPTSVAGGAAAAALAPRTAPPMKPPPGARPAPPVAGRAATPVAVTPSRPRTEDPVELADDMLEEASDHGEEPVELESSTDDAPSYATEDAPRGEFDEHGGATSIGEAHADPGVAAAAAAKVRYDSNGRPVFRAEPTGQSMDDYATSIGPMDDDDGSRR